MLQTAESTTLGLYSEITGVTLQDLRERTRSNYEVISQAISMRMLGDGAGAIFGGWLMDRLVNCGDLVIGIALTTAALVCVGIAYTPIVELMFVEFTIQGLMETAIAIAGQQSLVNIWEEKVSGPMHILHLGYGAGGFLVPQIAKPFLSKRTAETSSQFFLQNCIEFGNMTLGQNDTQLPDDGQEGENHFENAYIIVMAILLLVAFIYYAFFCCSRRQMQNSPTDRIERTKTVKEIFNFNSCSPGHPYYAAIIFAFLVIWFYISVGGQMIFANYLYSYCRDMLCLDKDHAADIQSMFWIGFTAGRFMGFVAAIWIPMKILIFIEAGGNLMSAVVLFFNPGNATVVKIFALISGFFVGPLYPSGIAWANRYITMTGLAYTITLIGGSLAGVSFTVAIGWYFEHKGPGAIWYFVIGYSCVACVTAIMMHLVARTRGDKYEREEDSEECNKDSRSTEEEMNELGE